MKNVASSKYTLAIFAVVGAVCLLIAFFALQDGQDSISAARMGYAGADGVNKVAKPSHDEGRPGCGSHAFSPFGSGVGCTEAGADAGDKVGKGVDDFDEMAASNEELAARQKLMTSKALAGDTGAFAWYINLYTERCDQLEPQQLAAITECDPALRSRVDAQFVQVASKLAAANNTEAQIALGRWYLAQAAKKSAAISDDANAVDASAQADNPQQAALADSGLPVAQSSSERKDQSPEYIAAAEWFARASFQSPAAADYLAFTNRMLRD